MTTAWRTATLQQPQYRPDLDLVAVTPDGQLAGFCGGWLGPDGSAAQIEPLGVHPQWSARGIGSALLAQVLTRFASAGANRAIVEVEPGNQAAVRSYRAAGFGADLLIRAAARQSGPSQ
jgi:mycothiol synthase